MTPGNFYHPINSLPASVRISMMKITEDCLAWFRSEAENLPYRTKIDVINIISDKDLVNVFFNLQALVRDRKLPSIWDEKLTDFFFSIH